MDTTVGFFTDETLCIGCKACEVACKQWNQLPDDGFRWTGMSHDNTGALGGATWRHVLFREDAPAPGGGRGVAMKMLSDVCKHCERAGCLEACPTGAIVRTDHGSVYVQPDICNGCGYCVPACPFGVIARRDDDGRAWKCTLCYDRLQGGLEPACAKACPTDSITFGPIGELRAKAHARVEALRGRGVEARLYGESEAAQPGTGGLHAFFLITDEPAAYGLPPRPEVPTRRAGPAWRSALAAAAGLIGVAVASVFAARSA